MKNRKRGLILTVASALLAASALVGWTAQGDKTAAKDLGKMVEQLGYKVEQLGKDSGKESWEFTATEEGLDVPVVAEVSGSGNYVWLTVYLADMTKLKTDASEFLESNAEIQPSLFYVTKNKRLMIALPLENRSLTNAMLRAKIEKIVGDVVDTKGLWQKG